MKWQKSKVIIDQMIKGSSGELWGSKLEQSDHFKILDFLLNQTQKNGLLVDVGCGAGDVFRVWGSNYLGVDLDWIIENVSKSCNPLANYKSADVLSYDFEKIPNCSCILMNAFLDVIENPSNFLEKICQSKKAKFIIVHRQQIKNIEKDESSISESYGKSLVPRSIMSLKKLNSIIENYCENEVNLIHWSENYYSFILRIK